MVLYISSKSSQVAEFEKELGSAFPHATVDKLQSNLFFSWVLLSLDHPTSLLITLFKANTILRCTKWSFTQRFGQMFVDHDFPPTSPKFQSIQKCRIFKNTGLYSTKPWGWGFQGGRPHYFLFCPLFELDKYGIMSCPHDFLTHGVVFTSSPHIACPHLLVKGPMDTSHQHGAILHKLFMSNKNQM